MRENIDHPIIKRVRAEDIEDYTERRNTAQARAERDAAYGERDVAYMEAARWKKLALAAGVKEDALVGVQRKAQEMA